MFESSVKEILTEAQSEILSYWRSLTCAQSLPKRGAFDPGLVLRYLRDLTVLELTDTGAVSCRLTSSSLKARLPQGAHSNFQTLGLNEILNHREPVIGQRNVEDGTHHWLRLPLLSDCGSRMMILCHDEFAQDHRGRAGQTRLSNSLSTRRTAIAA